MNLKRSLALTLSILMLLTVALPVAFGSGETLERLAGGNRWETAVKISQEGWTSAGTVVLANGRNFPDALAGVPLAYDLDAPILLTDADVLRAETKTEITRLGAGKVVILGGTGVISAAVETELTEMGLTVDRLEGDDRFETAAAIAAEVAPAGVDTVVLAFGRGYADALAAASYAAVNGYPILLSERNSVPPATLDAIEELGATNVIVVGGTGVISAAAVADLPGVTRIDGSNREETSVKLAQHFAPNTNKYFIATGDGFVDAVTGAVLAAKQGTGILLVRSSFPKVVGDFFASAQVMDAVIFGGTGVVSANVATAAAAKLAPAGATGVAGWTTESATVTIGNRSVVADKDTGFYQISGIAPGTHTVHLTKANHSPKSEEVHVSTDNVSVLNFELDLALVKDDIYIGGAVIDTSSSRPLAGVAAAVHKWNAKDSKWDTTSITVGVTGDNGSFNISNATAKTLDFGDQIRVTLSKDNYHSVQRTLTLKTDAVAHQFEGFYMTPIKKMEITGKVTDANGVVAGATVQLLNDKGAAISGAVTTTDSDGLYTLADQYRLAGAYGIRVTKTGYANHTATFNISEGVNRTQNAVLQPGYDVTFKLGASALNGEFNDGAFEAKLYRAGNEYATGVMTEIEAGDWPAKELEFKFENNQVAPGTYTLRVTGDHLNQKDFTVTVVNQDITRYGEATFAGTITGEVPLGSTVVLLNKAGAEVATQTLGATVDTYKFRNLAAGEYRVRVSKAGFQTEVEPAAPAAAEELAVNETVTIDVLTLEPNPDKGINGGTVYTAGSLVPIEGQTVTYYYKNVIDPETNQLFVNKSDVFTTAGDPDNGFYTTGPMFPGTYTVVVRAAGHETQVVERTIAAGDNYDSVNYFLQTGGNATLTLEVKDKDLDAVTTGFTLTDAWGEPAGTGAVYETSKYRFSALPAGTYTLEIDVDGHNVIKVPVVVARTANVTRTYNLVAEPTEYDVNVGIRGVNLAPVADATVVVTDAAGKSFVHEDKTSGTGQVALKLVDGTHKIAFYKHGLIVAETSVTVNKPTAAINLPWVTIYSWSDR